MNDIDMKLRERLRMLEEIDQMVNTKTSKPKLKLTNNTSTIKTKAVERYSNTNLSNEFDYPLQYREKDSKTSTTSQSKQTLNKDLSNYNINSNTQSKEKLTNCNKIGYLNNYNNDAYSTKEFTTEPLTGKSKMTREKEVTPSRNKFNNNIVNNYNSRNISKNNTKNRSKSPQQLVNINISISNDNRISASPEVGDRLYNYGIYIKDKIEKKKIESQSNRMRQMTPEITKKAKNIQRDPKKFYERLYPSHKINKVNSDIEEGITNINLNVNMNEYNENLSKCGEESVSRIYRRTPSNLNVKFEHKPKLDRNSLKMAENLGSAQERLIKKKPKMLNPNGNKSRSNSRTPLTERNLTPSHRITDMYSIGLEKMKKRDLIHNQKKIQNEEEFRNYSYKPKIIDYSPVLNISKSRSKSPDHKNNKSSDDINQKSPKVNMYDKSLNWKKIVDSRKEKNKMTQEKHLESIHTFKPKIMKDLPQNDDKFIKQNLSQIEDYVTRRRNVIQKKKEDEEYKKKKFSTGENYKGRITVTKEFNLHTDERSRSKSFDRNKNKSSSDLKNVNQIRNKMKTNQFFDNDNNQEDTFNTLDFHNLDQFSNPKNNQQNINRAKGNSENNDIQVFMNAVNNLHNQLVNFKI